jgi:hypothetical protein
MFQSLIRIQNLITSAITSTTDRSVCNLIRAPLFKFFSKRRKQSLGALSIWLSNHRQQPAVKKKAQNDLASLQHAISLSMSMVCPFCASSKSFLS